MLDNSITPKYNRSRKMPLITVYKPENELMAMSVKSLLEQSGIPVVLRSYQIPWYDGIAKMMRPAWGEILVDEQDYPQALEIVQNFLASEANDNISNEKSDAEGQD